MRFPLNTTSILAQAALVSSLVGLSTFARAQTVPQARPQTVYTVTYVPGPQWKAGQPPEKQDLAGHFSFLDRSFANHQLVANGFYGDAVKGLYVYNATDEASVMRLLRQDSGLQTGVVAIESVARWTVLVDQFDRPGQNLFVLDYRPGTSWNPAKTLGEQDLSQHLGYIAAQTTAGHVLEGGPVNDFQGRYIIAATDAAAARAFVQNDPSVQSRLFSVEVHPWHAFHRQTVAATRATGGQQ